VLRSIPSKRAASPVLTNWVCAMGSVSHLPAPIKASASIPASASVATIASMQLRSCGVCIVCIVSSRTTQARKD
jgi:hypothetical protein